ncbi:Eco57I restriction-modification methylase domain-containing protein [uncultured Treponema sp.]|uniref:Eco57I restriction-modification methylase domain-containing protein n=1 Tax=uncultured Treponema sp. TaxID=162155 RepID=UPI0025CF6386|nr:Eco57I restriction-modification methylase domain-containing protein [uncultured Treponema sp.]
MAQIFNQAFEQKLIYVYRINDTAHEGILKIGEASCNAGMAYFAFEPNSKELNAAAKDRIRHQTQTAGVTFELLYTEATAYIQGKNLIVFQDHDIHDILVRSGIKRKIFDTKHKANEWFYTDLETVKKAIAAAKEGRTSLNASEITKDRSPVIFRPEQTEAIEKTIKQFKKSGGSHQMLWNAKMRFGKTLSTLEVVKRMNYSRTLILTHRPVVDSGWFEDYSKIFYDRADFYYFSKKNGGDPKEEENFHEMIHSAAKSGMKDYHFIYFASIQDMRGSELVGGKFAKNEEIFNINWDLIIIDEAHEGTQTELGKAVLAACKKDETRILHLSGTPFNLMDDFKEEEIYTWDYVMEQRAKAEWDKIHQGDPNPYSVLPKLSIYTYNLGKLYPEYADEDIAFNFREFFRVDKEGNFIHESNVRQFLDLLTKEDAESNYPFSTEEYRQNFRHSLWMIPGVKEAKALSKLLQEHPVFSQFNIANVAGDGDEEEEEKEALKKVEKAIGTHPEETYSITLSCGRLTTGVSVKPWTACFMLSGSFNTAASTYMQTIFRVQTPAVIGGKQKEECFVFDFAPDRMLKVIAETAKISSKAGKTTQDDREILGDFLNFCPIIGFEGSQMQAYNTEKMLGQLKKAYIERVVKNGFEDSYLYNDELMHMDRLALEEFSKLKEIIGSTKAQGKTGDININAQGLTDEQYELLEQPEIREKPPKEITPEQQEALEREKEIKKNRDTAVSILRGISIRMPLLIYGADLKQPDGFEKTITLDNFSDLVDDLSWEEFMPKGVTKEIFAQFKKYYDPDVFRESGVKIREMTRAADKLSIEERIERISAIFATFRNPDKETVLTPWRVVTMHLSQSIGGWCFYNKDYTEQIAEPKLIEQNEITNEVFKKNAHILEINSKSGLYALYCAYSVYRTRAKLELGPKPTREMEKDLWKRVLVENIFLVCKTPMAKKIAQRTLAGFSDAKVNAHYFEDFVNQLKNKPENFINKVSKTNYWKKDENGDMKFDAIVGNPPYQEETIQKTSATNGQAPRTNIFHYFQMVADSLTSKYTSLIYPAGRWIHRSGKGKGFVQFGLEQINDKSLQRIDYYPNSQELFKDIGLDDGISIVLKNKNKKDDGFLYVYHENEFTKEVHLDYPKEELIPLNPQHGIIVNKVSYFVCKYGLHYLFDRILPRSLFGIESSFVEDNQDKVRPYSESQGLDREKEVKLLVNDKSGSAGRTQWFIVNKSLLKTNVEYIDEFQVVVSSAHPGGQAGRSNQIEIIDNHSAFGRSRVALASFKTEIEAKNFFKYANANLIRFMFLMTDEALTSLGKKVPDIMDYTNQNKLIDFSKDLNKQLYDLVGLESEEVEYIEKNVRVME